MKVLLTSVVNSDDDEIICVKALPVHQMIRLFMSMNSSIVNGHHTGPKGWQDLNGNRVRERSSVST